MSVERDALTVSLLLVAPLDGGDGGQPVLLLLLLLLIAPLQVGGAQPPVLCPLFLPALLVVAPDGRPQSLLLFLSTNNNKVVKPYT